MELFRSPQSSAVTVLAATAILAAGAFLTTNIFGSGGAPSSELLPALTEEETLEAFRAIMDKIKLLATRMIRGAENIKQQIQAQGQHIEDAQLMKSFILPHFDTGFEEIQKEVLTELDIDEADLEEAFNYYYSEGNPALKDISDRIRTIYREFGGAIEEDAGEANAAPPKEIDSRQFMALLNDLTGQLIEHTQQYVVAYVEEHGVPASMDTMEKFQHGLLSLTEGVEKALLDENGLTQMDFQSTLMKHQHSPEVQEIFIRMQRENERVMTENGIRMQ